MSYDILAEKLLQIPSLHKKMEGQWLGPVIGIIKSPPPNIEIEINGGLILNSKRLTINYTMTDYYKRDYTLEGSIDEITIETESNNLTNEGGPPAHTHKHGTIKGSGQYKTTGNITNTDPLKVGDKVLLIPEIGNKIFHILMKVEVF